MGESGSKSKTRAADFSAFALSARQLSEQIEAMRRNRVLHGKVVSLDEFRQLRQHREPATVLVVDDDRALREELARALEAQGFQAVTVDGAEQFRSAIAAHPVDLILLDADLPWLDGLEFCAVLKGQRALRDIPVILTGGEVSKNDARKGFEAGCDEYLTKPLDMERLVRTLRYMLQR